MTSASVNRVFSALFSNNNNGPSQSPSKVPTFSGRYVQSYRILRVEKSSQIQGNLTEDFFVNYNFDYISKEITDTSSDVKDNYLVIKQDNENPQFGIIFEDTLQALIRPIKGIRPCVCVYKSDHWVMTSSDYDDNGVYKFKMITNEKNEVIEMEGYYSESGYSELGPIQSPTIATVKYVKVSDSLQLVKEPSVERDLRMRSTEDLMRQYLPVETTDEVLKNEVLSALADPTSGEIEIFYDRLKLSQQTLQQDELIAFSNQYKKPYTHAINFKGNIYANIGGKRQIVGTINALNGYTIQDGSTTCDANVVYSLYRKDDWQDESKSRLILETNNVSLNIGFKTVFLSKLKQNLFLLSETVTTFNNLSSVDRTSNNETNAQLTLNGLSNGWAIAKFAYYNGRYEQV
jgi:hypothetical protein